MAIFLGIDGGGTTTSCLVGDEQGVLGAGKSGASNIVRVGEKKARQSIVEAIDQACAEAKVDPQQIVRTFAGVAGGARPEVAVAIRKIIGEVVPGEAEVAGDMVIALHAAFGKGPGIVVIAGTGSMAYGRNLHGKIARAGGWGAACSDEGSGYWIGRAAVAATLRAMDENSHFKSSIPRAIITTWDAGSRDGLVARANQSPDFAELFPAVLACADSSDELAAEILRQAGGELALLAKIIIKRLFAHAGSIPLAMVGGVFGNSALVREAFYNQLTREHPHVVILEGIVKPVQGALDLARG